jgi:hypothetical protein
MAAVECGDLTHAQMLSQRDQAERPNPSSRSSSERSATSARPARAAPKNAGGHGRESVSAKSGNSSRLALTLLKLPPRPTPAAPSHTESECHSCCARCDGRRRCVTAGQGCATASHSVAFGWLGLAATTHTTCRCSSGQYQTRPPAVTSYCHWSKIRPLISRVASRPRSRCWRAGFSGRVGRSVSTIHASQVLPRATRQSSSQPFAASEVANRASHPPGRAGGATRSPRLAGTRHEPSGAGTGPRSSSTGRVSSSARTGSAKTAAVAFHSTTTWARTLQRPSSADAWTARTKSLAN